MTQTRKTWQLVVLILTSAVALSWTLAVLGSVMHPAPVAKPTYPASVEQPTQQDKPKAKAPKAKPAPVAQQQDTQPAPKAEPAPKAGERVTYEDGSYRNADGSTGCTPGALCDDTPKAEPDTDWTRGLPPCEYEDSENCYWNASERGNGIGDSFVNVDGTVIYK